MNQQLIDAIRYNDLEKVKYFVSLGADIRSYNDEAVRCASSNGHLEVVKYLVSQGADIRSRNNNAVHWASSNGHLEVVKYLVSLGADIRSQNDSAVRWASESGNLEMVKYLVSIGAVIRCLTPVQQKYILFCQKMEEKKRLRAQKKIYFWWIQICYDPKTKVGKRMLEKSWVEFNKVQKKEELN